MRERIYVKVLCQLQMGVECYDFVLSVHPSCFLALSKHLFELCLSLCSFLRGATHRSGFPGGSVVKNPSANAGDAEDAGSVSGLGRSLGGGNGNPLQYSCLGNPVDKGAWQATIQRIEKSQT